MATTRTDRRRVRQVWTGAWLLTLLLVAGAGGLVGGLIANAIRSSNANDDSGSAQSTCSIPQVAADDLKSVVTISASSSGRTSTGSGEIIRADGYIVTNNHVVQSVASGGSLDVLFGDGSSASATIVGRDPETDLAVIKTNVGRSLAPIAFGSSQSVRVGEPVIALGAPLGLSSTVTSGIVSALDRTVEVPGESSRGTLLIDAIQTDAAINPGNSGGALVNCSGQFIGMPSAGATVPTSSGESSGGSIGLGFAIPVDLVRSEADEIIATGRVTHAYLGVVAEPLSVNATPQVGTASGLLVTSAITDGPAARAGLKAGDIIVTIDGRTVSSTDQLVALTLSKRPNDKVEIVYERDGRRVTTTLVLAARP